MKICVLGLDGAAPEIIFGDERLSNIRRVMEAGIYGRVQSVTPPGAVPGWMCMATSQDPGSLGVYGIRNRSDHSYKLNFANSDLGRGQAIWDELGPVGKKSIVAGVQPSTRGELPAPPEVVGEYPTYSVELRSADRETIKQNVSELSSKQWDAARRLLTERSWDYFQFVDFGLGHIQRTFWSDFDQQHVRFKPGNPYQNVIPEYYQRLDGQIGAVLELLDSETILLLVSEHGAQSSLGTFAINEWLRRQGLLVLNESPAGVTRFDDLNVNWESTKAWAEGGDCGSLFVNLRNREPQGIIDRPQYEAFREQLKRQLETLKDTSGKLLNASAFKPEEIYRILNNVAPDLIVQFAELKTACVDSVGHSELYLDDMNGCSPTSDGIFILAAPNCPLRGEYEGAHLLDIAPTLLDLAGYDVPKSMQGRSLVAGMEKRPPENGQTQTDEQLIHERLAGLGYV